MSEVEALMNFRLAPLAERRDMAMLGLIQRTVLGVGPPHFAPFFCIDPLSQRLHRRRHTRHLLEQRDDRHMDMVTRSALGLVSVYNLLPQWVVDSASVTSFQRKLQKILRSTAAEGRPA